MPDLIDKPLAWTVELLPAGRSLAHSAIVLGPAIVLFAVLVDRHRRVIVAGAIGIVSHLAGDALGPILDGDIDALAFLAWPLLAPPTYRAEQSFLAHLRALELTPLVALELLLVGLAIGVWAFDRRDESNRHSDDNRPLLSFELN
ncbi:MAG: metal-dependent hydrolase [Halococcoides sp.]